MSPLIQGLHDYLHQHYAGQFELQAGEAEMIVTIATPFHARQSVKAETVHSRFGEISLLKLRSRACFARDHRTVTAALESNADANWPGLALDTSAQPPVLDVVYSLPARSLDPREFVLALTRVANLASEIGQRAGDLGRF